MRTQFKLFDLTFVEEYKRLKKQKRKIRTEEV